MLQESHLEDVLAVPWLPKTADGQLFLAVSCQILANLDEFDRAGIEI